MPAMLRWDARQVSRRSERGRRTGTHVETVTNDDGSVTDKFRFVHDPKSISEKAALVELRKGIVAYLKAERLDDRDWLNYFPDNWADAVAGGIMDGINGFGTDEDGRDPPTVYKNADDDIVTYASRGPYGLHTEASINKYTGEVTRAYVEID